MVRWWCILLLNTDIDILLTWFYHGIVLAMIVDQEMFRFKVLLQFHVGRPGFKPRVNSWEKNCGAMCGQGCGDRPLTWNTSNHPCATLSRLKQDWHCYNSMRNISNARSDNMVQHVWTLFQPNALGGHASCFQNHSMTHQTCSWKLRRMIQTGTPGIHQKQEIKENTYVFRKCWQKRHRCVAVSGRASGCCQERGFRNWLGQLPGKGLVRFWRR